MDTKSKNIKYSKPAKAAALFLALVMFFFAGFFANRFVRGFADYNGYENRSFTQTTAFRVQMNDFIRATLRYGEYSSCTSVEDFKKTSYGAAIVSRNEERIAEVKAAYDLLDKSGVKVYIDGENRYRYSCVYNNLKYYFAYDGTLITYDEFNSLDYVVGTNESEIALPDGTVAEQVTSVAGYYEPSDNNLSVPKKISDISHALNLLNSLGSYTCYGEASREEAIKIIEEELKNELEAEYAWQEGYYPSYEVQSVKYAVFYKSTGNVITNCGVTRADTEQQIIEKLGGGEFAESIVNGKYTLIKGTEAENTQSFFSKLHNDIFSNYDKNSALSSAPETVSAAYFSFAPTADDTDMFVASRMAFDDYSGSRFNSLSLCLWLTALSLLISCAAFVYLISAAGKTAEGIKINFVDRIPFEISGSLGLCAIIMFGFLAGAIAVCEFQPINVFPGEGIGKTLLLAVCKSTDELVGICTALCLIIWTGLNMSLARNIRNKSFWRHTLCYWLLRPVRWLFKKLASFCRRTIDKFEYIIACDYSKGNRNKFKIIACCVTAAFLFFNGMFCMIAGFAMRSAGGVFLFIFLLLVNAAVLMLCLLLIVSLDRIMACVSDIKNGKLNSKLNTTLMPGFMRRFAEDILSMQDGLQNAVDSAIKDQRMKAELITNVSHDLKTPLTSIVNYVDLLKKCNVEDETAQKYISVLDEKAAKMKKLIEDLVEASKASTGAVEIHPVKLNLCEFAAQSVGEHEDELRKYNIELVMKSPEAPVFVTADSQKTSRIVENLFSNIRKYALDGTRVYIEVLSGENYGSLVFKNISKYALDIPADELTQRFVRGDASRSGEGSGLGLSIAQNLCELQHGKFKVHIDGDLFKVTVALPKAE